MLPTRHKHQCRCGCVWEHGPDAGSDDKAHRCPECGELTFVVYDGPDRARYFDHHKETKANARAAEG